MDHLITIFTFPENSPTLGWGSKMSTNSILGLSNKEIRSSGTINHHFDSTHVFLSTSVTVPDPITFFVHCDFPILESLVGSL